MRVPPDAVLAAWRQQAVQAEMFGHFADARLDEEGGAHWRAEAGCHVFEWDWREEAAVEGQSVRFASVGGDALVCSAELSVVPSPVEFGAEATLVVDYALPADAGSLAEALTGRMLRQFKALLESGEVPLPSVSHWERRGNRALRRRVG